MGRQRTRRETRDTTKALWRLVARLAAITHKCRDQETVIRLWELGAELEVVAEFSTAPPKEQNLGLVHTFAQGGDRVRVEGQSNQVPDGTYQVGGTVEPEPEGVGHA